MLPLKDPEEEIVVTFDFAPLLAKLGLGDVALSDVAVETGRDQGDGRLDDSEPPQVLGVKVLQLYKGGTRQTLYDVACLATLSNGERRRLFDVLPIS